MNNYSQFRLNHLDEIAEMRSRCGEQTFDLYKNSVFMALRKLKKGDRITIDKMVKKANVELFIKITCEFILSNPEYTFADDYSYVKRTS